MPDTLREKVRAVMHLPEGYTKVLVESVGGVYRDIATSVIPPHLRQMGTRFIVEATTISGRPEVEKMTAEEMRSAVRCSIHEIRDEQSSTPDKRPYRTCGYYDPPV
jgi:hypothetical protein